jgi:hypothetical protein
MWHYRCEREKENWSKTPLQKFPSDLTRIRVRSLSELFTSDFHPNPIWQGSDTDPGRIRARSGLYSQDFHQIFMVNFLKLHQIFIRTSSDFHPIITRFVCDRIRSKFYSIFSVRIPSELRPIVSDSCTISIRVFVESGTIRIRFFGHVKKIFFSVIRFPPDFFLFVSDSYPMLSDFSDPISFRCCPMSSEFFSCTLPLCHRCLKLLEYEMAEVIHKLRSHSDTNRIRIGCESDTNQMRLQIC